VSTVWISYFSRKGDQRDVSQDALVVGSVVVAQHAHPMTLAVDTATTPVVAVLDGVGGQVAGHLASVTAANHLAGLLSAGNDYPRPAELRASIVEVSRRLIDEGELVPDRRGMASTVAGLCFTDDGVDVFNVGDSRVYVERDGYLCQCTIDDLAGDGAEGSPLSQCLGAGFRHFEPHITRVPWKPSGLALLCTDGLDRRVGIERLEDALRAADPILALWSLAEGADDDATAVLIDGRFANGGAQVRRRAAGVAITEPEGPSEELRDVRSIRSSSVVGSIVGPDSADGGRGTSGQPEPDGTRSGRASLRRRVAAFRQRRSDGRGDGRHDRI